MTARAERRRQKKAAKARFAELAPIPRRADQGRQRMAQIEAEKDAANVALAARVKRGAKDADAARDPLHGSDMGRCILAITTGDDLQKLRQAWASICAAHHEYCARILSRSPHPQGAAIAVMPEPMEADPSLRVDLRTPDDKDKAAKRTWDMWSKRIATLPTPMHRWAISNAIVGPISDSGLWIDGQPTAQGRVAVMALKIIADTH